MGVRRASTDGSSDKTSDVAIMLPGEDFGTRITEVTCKGASGRAAYTCSAKVTRDNKRLA